MAAIKRDNLTCDATREFYDACQAYANSLVVLERYRQDVCTYNITRNNGVQLKVYCNDLVDEFMAIVQKFVRPDTLETKTKTETRSERKVPYTFITFRIQRG